MQSAYLNRLHFFQMLLLAMLTHIVLAVVWDMLPHDKVTAIPVYALSIRLGDEEGLVAVSAAPAPQSFSMIEPSAGGVSVRREAEISTPAPNVTISENAVMSLDKTLSQKSPLDAPADIAAALAQTPTQYVRQDHTRGSSSGSVVGNSDAATAEILSRYEQQISLWIQRHKMGAGATNGLEGDGVVRIRIDRRGNIISYWIEQSTHNTMLDDAILDMVKRANPVPAVPNNYPAGEMFEFLVPVSFSLK